ncbi:transposase, partial [Streptococcus pneumoniae]
CGERRERFKVLYWDGQGFWRLYKRNENGKLTWLSTEKDVNAITSEQVDWLMEGFSITHQIYWIETRIVHLYFLKHF